MEIIHAKRCNRHPHMFAGQEERPGVALRVSPNTKTNTSQPRAPPFSWWAESPKLSEKDGISCCLKHRPSLWFPGRRSYIFLSTGFLWLQRPSDHGYPMLWAFSFLGLRAASEWMGIVKRSDRILLTTTFHRCSSSLFQQTRLSGTWKHGSNFKVCSLVPNCFTWGLMTSVVNQERLALQLHDGIIWEASLSLERDTLPLAIAHGGPDCSVKTQ